MAKVPASEIVTADKTSGRGPADILLTAGANPLSEERTATITISSGSETRQVRITQKAGEQVVVIPEFDYLVLRYSWEAQDGTDFDTATGFTNTGIPDVDNVYVGWSRGYTTTKENVGEYLVHGGDNMQSGKEAALINMKKLLEDPNIDESEPNVIALIYGNWYSSRGRGNVVVSFTAYLGGEMVKKGFNFENEGGEEVYTGEVTTNVRASGGENFQDITSLYTRIGQMVYAKETRDCVILVGN